ncbi:MAG TPA: transcriptional regulator [Cytophagaceae bacterium]|jgi:DNA-binding MarR family transcriptional regulator|nr:transcriptional regulator [Cytophagaceae bacterium]
MKNIIQNINKAFENRIRLGVMSILMVNDWVDFNTLKELLQVTDGNLASHITALEKEEYIQVRKAFIGKKPNTSFAVSKAGRKAFQEHLNALENLIKARKQ